VTAVTRPKARTTRRRTAPFVVMTGLSGAGKSHAIRALEDLGYFCVDNLPIALIPTFADLTLSGRNDLQRAAVVVDIREGRELARFPAAYRRLKRRLAGRVRLVFLEADDASLVRRFSETRRPHPLAGAESVSAGIAEERRRLAPIRQLADQILDTSALTVHQLRRRIHESTGGRAGRRDLVVAVVSFGFRHGVPEDADLVFDVRFLPNPHFVPALKRSSGRNEKVARYVLDRPVTRRFLTLTERLLKFLVPQYVDEGKTYLTIAVGCTGGRHRSVVLAEAIGRRLRRLEDIQLRVRHRDIAET
jgi:UPF0042 nucleotide-binding protein